MTSLRAATQRCPDDEQLAAFVEGRLGRAQSRRVGEHLRACDACCDVVERYASAWQLDTPALGTVRTDDGPHEPAPALAPGQSFGRFVLLHLAGRGGMADVYAAYDPVLDRRIALKLLHAHAGDEVHTRMLHEARTVASLAHPHIVAIYDVGNAHGRDYIAMEFVDGGTLAQWLATDTRSIAAIVEAFHQAGLGLAAAHAHGVVHRDFKPANVLVGRDARVRVADFGLALPSGGAARRAGTRGYVAPEQARGATPNPLADQYSFCVALHEALGGGAPAITESEPDVPAIRPARARLGSRRLAAVIARGMDPDPSRRFPSMIDLLSALAPRRRRRLALAATATAAVALVLFAVAAERDTCPPREDLRAGLWTDGDRERAHAAFSATELPYAETAWSRTQRELDARVDGWVERAHESCIATGPGNACTERARVELQRTIAVLVDADATTVTHAGALLDGLAGEDCRAPESTASPVDPLQRATLVGELATAKAIRRAGHDASARTQLHGVIDHARMFGDEEIRREAQIELAVILPGFGDDAGAIDLLTDVAYAALADEDDEIALEALTRLAIVEGSHRADREAGQRWERDATAVLVRLGSPGAAAAQLDRARAALHIQAHDYPAAIAAMRSVLAHAEATSGPESRATAQALRDLGLALYHGEQLDLARDSLERSLAIRERVLGDEHPEVAASMDLLFAVEQARGDHARALELARAVVPIYERVRGPDHLDTINAKLHLGSALEPTDPAAAHDVHASALEALVRVAGAEHPHVPGARMNLAKLDIQLGRFTEALAGARAAHEGFRALHGDDDVRTVAAAITVGEALRHSGRLDEARTWSTDALARSEHAGPGRRAAASDSLARLEYDSGNLTRAAELFDAGAALWTEAYGPDHPEAKASTNDAAECRAELAARER